MSSRPFEFESTPTGTTVRVRVRGNDVLAIPLINRGTAFTKAERDSLRLNGLMPSGIVPIEGQISRVYQQFREQPDALSKNVYLSAMRDRNEVLFYRLLAEHLEEMLPIVYTPTIGEAIQRYSHWYSRPRGVFLSIDDPDGIENAFLNYGLEPQDVDLVVATDSEGILGIGDQGVGGVQIAIGKLSVYTAAAGIHPRRAIPVVLDVGTDNLALLNDELYLGVRHARVRGERYDAFIDKFVEVTTRLYPKAMLHWEDFGASNAHRILEKYRHDICTFNDDVQGTAAVVAAAALAGVKATGERMSDQRIVVHGAGTAGVGIANLLRDIMIREGASPEEANARFWCLGSRGLITEALGDRVRPFQKPYARTDADVQGWRLDVAGRIGLADVVRNTHPTILIGTSGQPGTFTEAIVRDMAAHTRNPIIMPLSNPTSLSEGIPERIVDWTHGKAMIATGSPFAPVTFHQRTYEIAQANNALVFPGLGLGVAVCGASRVSDGMIAAASEAIAGISQVTRPEMSLLPSITQLRYVSATVALAVVKAAQEEGLATVEVDEPVQAVYQRMWHPVYPDLEVV